MKTKNKMIHFDGSDTKTIEEIKMAFDAGEEFFRLLTPEGLFLALRILHRRKIRIITF